MNILKKIDNALAKIMTAIAGVMVFGIMIIIMAQVVARNVFAFDLGAIANYSVLFMSFAVWAGAIVAARANDHLSIKLMPMIFKNERILKGFRIFVLLVIIATLSLFTVSSVRYIYSNLYLKHLVQTSVDLPKWILCTPIPISTGVQTIYYVVHFLEEIIGGGKK